jgi:CrcB protein
MIECLFVGIGGFVGSVCRYLIGLIPINPSNGFPVKTLIINIAGAFAIGLIVAIAGKHASINPRIVLMLKTGVCGGFTTFSTFALEISDLIQAGSWTAAIVYIVLSLVLGTGAVFAAQMI